MSGQSEIARAAMLANNANPEFQAKRLAGVRKALAARNAILIELNPEYADMARERLKQDAPLLTEVS